MVTPSDYFARKNIISIRGCSHIWSINDHIRDMLQNLPPHRLWFVRLHFRVPVSLEPKPAEHILNFRPKKQRGKKWDNCSFITSSLSIVASFGFKICYLMHLDLQSIINLYGYLPVEGQNGHWNFYPSASYFPHLFLY